MWRWILRTSGVFLFSTLFLTSPASAHPHFYVNFGVPGVSIGVGPGYYPGYVYPGYPGFGYGYPGYVYGYPPYGYSRYWYPRYGYAWHDGHRYYRDGGRYVRHDGHVSGHVEGHAH